MDLDGARGQATDDEQDDLHVLVTADEQEDLDKGVALVEEVGHLSGVAQEVVVA